MKKSIIVVGIVSLLGVGSFTSTVNATDLSPKAKVGTQYSQISSSAKQEVEKASIIAKQNADKVKQGIEKAKKDAQKAKQDIQNAKQDIEKAKKDIDTAKKEIKKVKQKAQEARRIAKEVSYAFNDMINQLNFK